MAAAAIASPNPLADPALQALLARLASVLPAAPAAPGAPPAVPVAPSVAPPSLQGGPTVDVMAGSPFAGTAFDPSSRGVIDPLAMAVATQPQTGAVDPRIAGLQAIQGMPPPGRSAPPTDMGSANTAAIQSMQDALDAGSNTPPAIMASPTNHAALAAQLEQLKAATPPPPPQGADSGTPDTPAPDRNSYLSGIPSLIAPPTAPTLAPAPQRNMTQETQRAALGAGIAALLSALSGGDHASRANAFANTLGGAEGQNNANAAAREQQWKDANATAEDQYNLERQQTGDQNAQVTAQRQAAIGGYQAAYDQWKDNRDYQQKDQQIKDALAGKTAPAIERTLPTMLSIISAQDPAKQPGFIRSLNARLKAAGSSWEFDPDVPITPSYIDQVRNSKAMLDSVRAQNVPVQDQINKEKADAATTRANAYAGYVDALGNYHKGMLGVAKERVDYQKTAAGVKAATAALTASLKGMKSDDLRAATLSQNIAALWHHRQAMAKVDEKTIESDLLTPNGKADRMAAVEADTRAINTLQAQLDQVNARIADNRPPSPDAPSSQSRLRSSYGSRDAAAAETGAPPITMGNPNAVGTGATNQHHSATQPRAGDGTFNGPPAKPTPTVTPPPSTGANGQKLSKAEWLKQFSAALAKKAAAAGK